MNETYQDLENQAIKDKNEMKTYYLEITKSDESVQIDKITTDEEHKARRKAISLMKKNPDFSLIRIVEVATKRYCTTIERE